MTNLRLKKNYPKYRSISMFHHFITHSCVILYVQHSQTEIIKLRESEEKQRRAREGREKAEIERAARAARKRALVDMNAHETQEGVMDSLMEALQTGSAFSRPDQRRKRQTRVAGGKLKIVRDKYGSSKITKWSPASRITIFDGSLKHSSGSQISKNEATPNAEKCLRSPSDDFESRKINGTTLHYTPTENDQEFKKIIMSQAKKAPKGKVRFLSRVSSFQRKCRKKDGHKSANPLNCIASPIFGKTPRRDVSVKISKNLAHVDSTSSIDTFYSAKSHLLVPSPRQTVVEIHQYVNSKSPGNKLTESCSSIPKIKRETSISSIKSMAEALNQSYASVVGELRKRTPEKIAVYNTPKPANFTPESNVKPRLCRETLLNEAKRLTPVKKKRVAIYKRNSIVRRAILNRKKLAPKRPMPSASRLQNYVGSPSNMNSSLPRIDAPAGSSICSQSESKIKLPISKSSDQLNDSFEEFSTGSLTRTKNFENISQVHDENQNDIVLDRSDSTPTFPDSSPANRPEFLSCSLGSIASPKNSEISGILELSLRSPPPNKLENDSNSSTIKSDDSTKKRFVPPTSPNIIDISECQRTSTPQTPEASQKSSPNSKTTPEKTSVIDTLGKTYDLTSCDSTKKSWKFWQRDDKNDKIVTLGYKKLRTSATDVATKMSIAVDHFETSDTDTK